MVDIFIFVYTSKYVVSCVGSHEADVVFIDRDYNDLWRLIGGVIYQVIYSAASYI